MRKFFKEFKEFISRGNVIDLAVAVIIGGAFTAIVTALTSKIISPLINWVIALIGGKEGLSAAYTILSAGYTDGELDLTKSIYIDWGAFISAIIDFILIALVLFIIIKAINASRKRLSAVKGNLNGMSKKEYKEERRAVKKQAKEKDVSFKTAWTEHLAEKERLALEAKKKQEEEDRLKAEEEERKAHIQETLLTEIRDLLKAQQK